MKTLKSILLLLLLTLSTVVLAVNYPTYKPAQKSLSPSSSVTPQNVQYKQYSGYSTVATGGTTTMGEGSALSGPRRTNYDSNNLPPQIGTEGDVYTDENGNVYVWNPEKRIWESEDGEAYNPASDPAPIGSPVWPMMLMALGMAAVIFFRRRPA